LLDARLLVERSQAVCHLILVKHSLPQIIPAVSPNQWGLSPEGQRRCTPLAQRLAVYQPAAIVTSGEPKAAETAALLAGQMEIPFEVKDGLHEHDRGQSPFLPADQFDVAMAHLFRNPRALVFGRETADQARERFTRALHHSLNSYPRGNTVVIAHGTVIALCVAHYTQRDPYELWQRLGFPSFVVLSLPDFALMEIVERVAKHQ
jgi:2,3-bisphosphoglycerate-dependent phosphoglycerate mutase